MKNSSNSNLKQEVQRTNMRNKKTIRCTTKEKSQRKCKTDVTIKSSSKMQNNTSEDQCHPSCIDDQDEDCLYSSGTKEMRDCFLKLRQLVPLDQDSELEDEVEVSRVIKTKISKLQLLQGAIDYILDLESTLESRMNGCTSHPIGQYVFPLSNQEEGLSLNADLQRQICCLPPSR